MGISVRKLAAALFAGLVLMGTSASAQVPDPYARELAQYLARAEQIMDQQNYARVAGPFAGGLGQGLRTRFQVTLRAGGDYRIVGVCDSHCRDLDLRAYAPNNVVLAEDVLRDDVPILSLRPQQTGSYTIEVMMPQCSGTPCYFAFNVYSR